MMKVFPLNYSFSLLSPEMSKIQIYMDTVN